MSDTTRRPASLCWHCSRMVDALSPAFEEASPREGDVTLCLYCGAIAFVGPDMTLVAPTHDQLNELEENAEFWKNYIRFIWARQHVMLNSHLLGYEEESSP